MRERDKETERKREREREKEKERFSTGYRMIAPVLNHTKEKRQGNGKLLELVDLTISILMKIRIQRHIQIAVEDTLASSLFDPKRNDAVLLCMPISE